MTDLHSWLRDHPDSTVSQVRDAFYMADNAEAFDALLDGERAGQVTSRRGGPTGTLLLWSAA